MARALRIQFPVAVYHVTSRGDRLKAIFLDGAVRQSFLELLAQIMDRFDGVFMAYCLMGNHYLDTDAIHGFLLGHEVKDAEDRRDAQERYASLVAAARDVNLWDEALRQQIYLGDEAFIERMQGRAKPGSLIEDEILLAYRSKPRTFAHWLANTETREEALRGAHL